MRKKEYGKPVSHHDSMLERIANQYRVKSTYVKKLFNKKYKDYCVRDDKLGVRNKEGITRWFQHTRAYRVVESYLKKYSNKS